MRFTPENITELKPNEIFVYGSNESSINGAGAALFAKKNFGAKDGIGFGPNGQCFAISTKSWDIQPLDLETIGFYIRRFVAYARLHPKLDFLVTPVGTGLCGYKPEDIAPLFINCGHILKSNIILPRRFWEAYWKISDISPKIGDSL